MNNEEKAKLAKIQKELPPKWIVRFSTKHANRVFYFNKATGVTTWTYPETEKDLTRYSIKKKRHSTSKKVTFSTNDVVHKKQHSASGLSKIKTLSKVSFKDRSVRQRNSSLKRTLKNEKSNNAVSNSKSLGRGDSYDSQLKLKLKNKKKRKSQSESEGVSDGDNGQVLAATVVSPLNRSAHTQHAISKVTSGTEIQSNNETNLSSLMSIPLMKNNDDIVSPHRSTHNNQFPTPSWVNPLLQKQDLELPANGPKPSPKPDVEMQDISAEEADAQPVRNAPTVPALIYVVVDTNVFLGPKGLTNIDALVNWYPLPKGHFHRALIVIPWIVLQELDHLKTKQSTAGKARQAVAFLNRHFCSKRPGIRGQTIMEAASLVEGLHVEMNDDRILQCCFFFSHLPGNHTTVLFSKDTNLCNKAMANHFKCFSSFEALKEGITTLCRSNDPPYDIEQTDVINCDRIENHLIDSQKFSHCNCSKVTIQPGQTISSQRIIQEDFNTKIDPLALTQELTNAALSAILEAEMKNAYGEKLWLDIIIRKPPWTLKDVLQCIKKHWIAVFSMAGMDRLLSVHVDELIKNLPCLTPRSPPQKQSKDPGGKQRRDFVCSSLVLISGMGKHHMDNPLVKDSINKLKKIIESMNCGLGPSAEREESVTKIGVIDTSPMPGNDENMMDDQESLSIKTTEDSSHESRALFWQILDKIWECIIEHCVAIFRSLNFLSSPAFHLAPVELQQQLSSEVTTEIPSPDLASHVIPLLMELIEGFLKSLERFLSACKDCSGTPALPECLDLLQTLWTITRAFVMTTSLEKIKPAIVHQSCRSAEDQEKLFIGHQKLLAIAGVLKECSSAVTANNSGHAGI